MVLRLAVAAFHLAVEVETIVGGAEAACLDGRGERRRMYPCTRLNGNGMRRERRAQGMALEGSSLFWRDCGVGGSGAVKDVYHIFYKLNKILFFRRWLWVQAYAGNA